MEFRQHTLDNGLEIVAECNDEVHSASFGFFVQTGSRDETEAIAGVSHFLEHMVFKGTPTRSADEVNREFDEMGAYYNAFTSEENTVYFAAVLPEYQKRSVALLTDIMRPSLREEDFDTEKKVIIEEIRMYDDQPPFGADDRVKALFFGSHPLAGSVLGTTETVSALTVGQMRNYFEQRYSPNNLFVAAAGKIDFEALVSQVSELCDGWKSEANGRPTPRATPHDCFEVIEKQAAAQQYVLQMAAGPAAEDDDRFAAKLLATIVGDDSGSRLYWELVDSGLAENASLGHYEYQGTGVFMSYLSCEPDSAAENLQRMTDVLREIERNGVTADELTTAKSKVKARVVLGSERPRSRLFSVGGDWAGRHEYRTVQDDLRDIGAVTLDAIRASLANYPLTTGTTVVIGPLSQLDPPGR